MRLLRVRTSVDHEAGAEPEQRLWCARIHQSLTEGTWAYRHTAQTVVAGGG